MRINAKILGLGNVIDGKEEKPDDKAAAAAWEVKDLKATGLPMNAPSMKIRIKLEHEVFDFDEMTPRQLSVLIHITVLGAPQEYIFNIIVDLNRINRQASTSLDAYMTSLLHSWPRIRPNILMFLICGLKARMIKTS